MFIIYTLFALSSCTPKPVPVSNTEIIVSVVDPELPLLPYQRRAWAEAPGILNCKGKSPYTLVELENAVERFTAKGEEVWTVSEIDCTSECAKIEGYVTITSPNCYLTKKSIRQGILATTKSFFSVTNIQKTVVIEMNTNDPEVIQHELGHAFGWSHCRQIGHLMYPTMGLSGYSMEGMYE